MLDSILRDVLAPPECPGVVPIFVNAGAALLPAIVAGVSSVLGVILKPRELVRVCRTKPHIPALVVVVGGLIGALIWYLAAGGPPPERDRSADRPTGPDWEKVAHQVIAAGGVDAFLAKQEPAEAAEAAKPAQDPKAAAIVAPAPAPAKQADLFFRMGPDRTGTDGGDAPTGLKEEWSYTEEFTMFLSSPTVQRGRLFAGTCYLDLGTSYGSVVCLDAKTGREIWMTDVLPGDLDLKGIFSSPAVTADGKSVLIGQGLHFDRNSQLVCLDAETGKVRWIIPTPLHLEGSPGIEGDIVAIGAGAIEKMPSRELDSHPGFVLAARISTGETLWKYDVNDPESSPVIADGIVYIGAGFNGNAIVALRTETDEDLEAKGLAREIWRAPMKHPITSAVTLVGDVLLASGGNGDYIASDHDAPEGVVVALSRADGKILWETKHDDAVLGAAAVADGKVVCGSRTGEVIALALDTGKLLWKQRVSKHMPVLAAPAIAAGRVYAVSNNGYLAVLNADTGEVLEKHYINDKKRPGEMDLCVSSPTIAGGRLHVGTETGGLRCYTGKGGER